MKLVITEKPSVAKDIAKVLKVTKKNSGFFEGNGYLISWAFGHLIQLVNPDKYDDKYKPWVMNLLPILPEEFKLEVVSDQGAKQQFETIKTLLNKTEVEEVICATDAGREGELIFRHIYHMSGATLPIKRLWISSQTDKAIKDGFKSLKDGADYEPLYHSALCRSESDWMVGINATRAMSILHSKGQGVLSVGRVQTPVLKLLVDRHYEITTFIPTTYHEVFAEFKHPNGAYKGKWVAEGQSRFEKEDDVKHMLTTCEEFMAKQGKTAHVLSVEKKSRKEKPPLLYDLTELQKEANKKFKFTADHTLKTAQSLYEKHKVLTYPRTSSRYLSKDIEPKLEAYVKGLSGVEAFQPYASKILDNKWKISSRMVDDKKVTDHHAIIPTEKTVIPGQLTDDEWKLFQLVMTRFLAAYFPDCEKLVTDVVTAIQRYEFKSNGTMVKALGWRELYEEADKDSAFGKDDDTRKSKAKKSAKKEKEEELPYLEKGETVDVTSLASKQSQTKAPPMYTEASILAAMETAGKRIEDEELRQAMKDSGLGTPATRAQILERLIKVGYVNRESNKLVPTDKAYYLLSKLEGFDIASAELTGQWEKKLNDIKNEAVSRETFMSQISGFTQELVKQLETETQQISDALKGKCLLCKGDIVEMPLSYTCRNWKENGCNFVIWKKIAGKRLSLDTITLLLEQRKTPRYSGFISKKGEPFEAALVIDGEGKVGFDFRKVVGKCPKCNEDLLDFQKTVSCSAWKKTNCDFVIWKQVAQKTLTEKHINILLKDGKTDVIEGFKARDGKLFSAKLELNKQHKVSFLFA